MKTTENLKLSEKVAAVRFSTRVVTDRATGIAEIIPAGEVIRLDLTAPLLASGRMRQVEWEGKWYGVFLEDLQERAVSN